MLSFLTSRSSRTTTSIAIGARSLNSCSRQFLLLAVELFACGTVSLLSPSNRIGACLEKLKDVHDSSVIKRQISSSCRRFIRILEKVRFIETRPGSDQSHQCSQL